MSARESVVDLVVNITAKATDAVGGADKVGDAYSKMSDRVDKAGSAAEKSGRRLKVTADGADNLATKAGTATGALGALGAGFELVGLQKYADGLASASMATDFLSGVGDSLTLVMESQALASARARAVSIAQGIATKALAVQQAVLNAVMSANPVMLVVLAVVALVAIFLVAYNRSERFRSAVQAVGRFGRAAITFLVNGVRDLIRWVGDKAPAAWRALQTKAVAVLRFITTPQRALITLVTRLVGYVRDKLPAAFETVRRKAGAIADALLRPFRSLFDLVDRILGLIGRIKLPRLPSLGGIFGRSSGDSGRAGFASARLFSPMRMMAAPSSTYSGGGAAGGTQIIIQGAIDPEATAKQIRKILDRSERRSGGVVFG